MTTGSKGRFLLARQFTTYYHTLVGIKEDRTLFSMDQDGYLIETGWPQTLTALRQKIETAHLCGVQKRVS